MDTDTNASAASGTLRANVEQAVAKGFRFEWDIRTRIVWAVGPGADYHSLAKINYNSVLDADRLGLAIAKMLNAPQQGRRSRTLPAVVGASGSGGGQ